MKKHMPLVIAAGLMLVMHDIFSIHALEKWLQIPSGYIAAFFLGAPVSFTGEVIEIGTKPLLTISVPCSGVKLFSILIGLGGGYWCGRKISRWLVLLPACYVITLFSNAARIVAGYHFRIITEGMLPDWLQEFAHMGVGGVWSLTVVALLVFLITRPSQPLEEPIR